MGNNLNSLNLSECVRDSGSGLHEKQSEVLTCGEETGHENHCGNMDIEPELSLSCKIMDKKFIKDQI